MYLYMFCFRWHVNILNNYQLVYPHSDVHLLPPGIFRSPLAGKTSKMETQTHNATNGNDPSPGQLLIEPHLFLGFQIQFCIIIAHATQGLKADCRFPPLLIYFFIPNVGLIFYMFYDFYRKAYYRQQKKMA